MEQHWRLDSGGPHQPSADVSRTAAGVALLRAVHQVLDQPPYVLDDWVALRLLGPGADQRIRDGAARFQSPAARGLRAHVVLRSRFAEDRLAAAVARGVGQYVVLGAGFDTFAYRQPEWATGLRVYKVDRLATQEEKRTVLANAAIDVPRNVVYVPVDFERETTGDRLVLNGFDPAQPAFFSWLGVTMYLDEQAIDDGLEFVVACRSGSEIVLTFATAPDRDEPRRRLADMVSALGEPWKSYFTPATITGTLRMAGFAAITLPTAEELDERYFRGRLDTLQAPRRQSIVAAIV